MKEVIQFQLPAEFSGRGPMKGFRFSLVKRSGDFCIYKVCGATGELVYEVIRVVKSNSRFDSDSKMWVKDENVVMERYPSSEQFGVCGWSFSMDGAIDRAKAKFNDLVSGITVREEVAV